ncbi:serine/threonine protein kinase [Podila verticillata NRRL 6337]|nr:serine/threonine protein kinase [Podila verticillata NRRL 6337]
MLTASTTTASSSSSSAHFPLHHSLVQAPLPSTMMPTIDFNNATEYSEVHGGTLIKPASSASSVHSSSSTASSASDSSEPSYKPVVLKWCRSPADFRDLLHAFTKIREPSPNIVTFYGATREHPSGNSTLAGTPLQSASNSLSMASLSLSRSPSQPEIQHTNTPRDWIVTKPSAHGTLHEYLKTPQGEALDWMGKIRLIRGVANGLLYLHEHGLLHMNLHSDNILVENGPTAVLTDFGQVSRSARGAEANIDHNLSHVTSPKSGSRWVHGGGVYEKGLIYTAPERLANPELNPCTAASDVYSLGVIMLEILTGHRSLAREFLTSTLTDSHKRLDDQITSKARTKGPMPSITTSQGTLTLPTAIESLIRKICSRDPAQRPGMMVIRSQLKEMANTSFDLHVREPINKGTTGIQLNAKKPISLISVVTTPSVIAEAGGPMTPEPSTYSVRSQIEPLTPKSPTPIKKRTSILRKALDMSLNSPPASPKRKNIQIWEAAVKGDVKTIHSLLSQGVSVNQRDPITDHTPLLAAVADLDPPDKVPNITILELLINRGAEINAFDHKTKQTLLHHLCSRPNPSPAVLKFLLDRGANPNAVSAARQTPLHYLAERAKTSPLEPMRLLLDFGAQVDAKGPVMWTALHLLTASEKPFLDAMMLLLTRDIDVNAKDSNQWTALHFVAHYNQDPTPALKILVDAGADVNALTKRREGVIQVLLKSKSIDRMAMDPFVTSPPSAEASRSMGGLSASGSTGGLNIIAGSAGSLSQLGQYVGGHVRKRSSASMLSNGSFSSTAPRFSTVAEITSSASAPSLASQQPELVISGAVVLSPEDEAKEEALKKLADLIRWLMVDCGVQLDHSLEYGDQYPSTHPKNQHVLFRAIRLGMRPIVAVLLETSLVMSEVETLDEALRVTEDMLTTLNSSTQPADSSHLGPESAIGAVLSSSASQRSHRRSSSVSSSSTNGDTGGGITRSNGTTIITPKTLAAAAAAISRVQEIEALLKVWRFGEQRQELVDSVKARLARSGRRRGKDRSVSRGTTDEDGCSSPVSSISSEREMVSRSTTM